MRRPTRELEESLCVSDGLSGKVVYMNAKQVSYNKLIQITLYLFTFTISFYSTTIPSLFISSTPVILMLSAQILMHVSRIHDFSSVCRYLYTLCS